MSCRFPNRALIEVERHESIEPELRRDLLFRARSGRVEAVDRARGRKIQRAEQRVGADVVGVDPGSPRSPTARERAAVGNAKLSAKDDTYAQARRRRLSIIPSFFLRSSVPGRVRRQQS